MNFDRLRVRPRWRTDATDPGLVIAAMADPATGAELVHLINAAPYPLTFTVRRDDRVVTPKPLTVPARGAGFSAWLGRPRPGLLMVVRVGCCGSGGRWGWW